MDYANQTWFITIATLSWALGIEAPLDAKRNTMKPSVTEWVDTGIAVYVLLLEVRGLFPDLLLMLYQSAGSMFLHAETAFL